METAKSVYEKLCASIEARDWNFTKEEDDLVVHFQVQGDDLPMLFIIRVDESREIISLLSPLPTKMREEKRVDGAIAACIATSQMLDGSFDYDLENGRVCFRMTNCYAYSTITSELLEHMVDLSCFMVDEYNDLFMALDNGIIDIDKFKELANK